jgi:hypothetical protein
MRKLLLALLGAVSLSAAAQSDEVRPPKTHSWARLDKGAVGCPTLVVYKKLQEAARSGDKEMFLTTTIYGGCKLFDKGATLWIEDLSTADGAVQARAKDDKTSYWLSQDSVFKPAS